MGAQQSTSEQDLDLESSPVSETSLTDNSDFSDEEESEESEPEKTDDPSNDEEEPVDNDSIHTSDSETYSRGVDATPFKDFQTGDIIEVERNGKMEYAIYSYDPETSKYNLIFRFHSDFTKFKLRSNNILYRSS